MTTAGPEIAIVATLPEDVRGALSRRFTLGDHFLERRDAVPPERVPAHYRVVATRALLGVPAGL
jgi:hypothetical protein